MNMKLALVNFLCKNVSKQDGPSLESSSYLNTTLRYLGHLDPGTLRLLEYRTLGPLVSHYLQRQRDSQFGTFRVKYSYLSVILI